MAGWLALGLALAYLAVMAMLMWLFESVASLDGLEKFVRDPRRMNLWLLILLSAVAIFAVTRWALPRISESTRRAQVETNPARPGRPGLAGLALGGLALLLALTGGYVLREQNKLIAEAQFRQIGAAGSAKAQIASRWLIERRRDMAGLLENTDFQRNAAALLAAPATHSRPGRLPALEALVQANSYLGAVLVDSAGRGILGIPAGTQASEACSRVAAGITAGAGDAIVQTQAFAVDDGTPTVAMVGALGGGEAPIGAICVRVSMAVTLLPALAHWSLPTRTGQILLGRFEGDDVLVLNLPQGEPGRFAFQRLPGAGMSWRAALAATEAGQLHERDAHDGVRWLRAVFRVEGAPWVVVARMNAADADRLQGQNQRRVAVIAGFGFVFMVAVAMVGLARAHARAAAFDDERSALIGQLEELAHFDGLTGLPRRQLTEDRLQVALAMARRDGAGLGLLFIDLDGFKAINDLHGHAAGDAALQAVADRLQRRLREGDTVGRIGGDEFLVVLPGCASARALGAMGEHFAQAASTLVDWHGTNLAVRASVGGALFPAEGNDAATLTAAADAAMYRAKQSGGGYRGSD